MDDVGYCDFCRCHDVVRNGAILEYKGVQGSIKIDNECGCLYGQILGIDDYISYEHVSMEGLKVMFKEVVDSGFC